jgi:aminopeptidase N
MEDALNVLNEFLECRAFSAAADGRFALSGSKPHYAPDRTFDAQHIRLELKLDMARKSLSGLCRTTLEALSEKADRVVFDAVHFKDLRVKSSGRPLKFDYNDRQIIVHFSRPFRRGQRVDVEVSYRVVQPKLGLHFVGPDRQYPDKPQQAWTQGESL